MLSSLASLLDSFRIPNRKRRGFNIFSRRRRRQTSSLRCQGIPGVSLQETLAHEPLEQRRLLAVDVSLAGSVLTVSFDDASDDAVSVAITSEGYDSSGANVSSGTGTITQLVVQDSGTAQTSSFTLTEASQNLTGGVDIASEVDAAAITSKVNTDGGDVAIDSSQLTLSANINSGSGNQNYGGEVVLASDVNLTTSTGVPRDMHIHFQGPVDSDGTPRALNVKSEAIYFDADVGSTSPLNTFGGQTANDKPMRGQFYRSVSTSGSQIYQAGLSSGDIEFNGTYTATSGDINLLGAGQDGVVLSLTGDTEIHVGSGEFTMQKGSSVQYPGGYIVSQGKSESYDLTITAGNITAPAGIGKTSDPNLSFPQINNLTINGAGQVGLNTPEVITTGNFTANPQIRIYQDTTLLSGDGEINLSSGVNNGSKALTLGDAAQTGDIFVGGLQVRHLEVGAGDFDIELNGSMHLATNMTSPTKFLNTGNLTLYGQGSSFFGGVEALSVANTFVAGCVATFGADINLNNVSMIPGAPYANRFDARWTQTHGATADGGNISISNFTSDTSKSVEFDIGNGAADTVTLTGTINSTNPLYFKGVGSVEVPGDATLAGGVHAQNLSHEDTTTPALNFSGNVTLTGPMEFEGVSAAFANSVEGGGNDLTLNFTQTATLDDFSNVGNFTSVGAVNLSGDFNTTGFQKYEGNVSLDNNTQLAATMFEFQNSLAGNNHNLSLSSLDGQLWLDGINLSDVNQLTLGGDVYLGGNLNAAEIIIQGDTKLIGDATINGTNNVSIQSGKTIDGTYDLTLQTGGDISIDGDLGATDALKNLAIGANGTVEITGNISTTEDIEIIAQGANVGLIVVNKSGVLLSGDVDTVSGNINITALGAVANGTGVELDGGIKLDGQKIEIYGKAEGRGVHFENGTTLTASGEIVVEGESTHSNTSYKNYEGVRLNGNSNFSAGTDLTIIGTTPAGNAVSLQANTTLTATNNLSINASFTGSATNDRYGFAAWSDVVMTADNLLIEGSTTGDSSAKSIGFDDNNNVTGHSSVHLIGDRLELSYKGNTDLYVNGNGSLIIESESASFGQEVSLEKVTIGNNFTSATIGKTTNTGDVTIGVEGLNIAGPIEIYGGNTVLEGEIVTTASDANITINGTGITVGANVSATSTGDIVFNGPTTLTNNVSFSGQNMTLGGLDGGGHSVELDLTNTEIDAGIQSFTNIVDLTVTGAATINGTIQTTGNQLFQGATKLIGDTTLLSGNGSINLSGGANNGSKALTLGDSNQTGSIFVGGLQVRHLEVGAGDFDIELNGSMHLATNMTSPTKFLNTGNLTLYGQGSSFFGGVEALSVANTFVAGCVATFGADINLNNVSMINGAPYANRFDARWTQTHGKTADGGNISISNFTSDTSKSVEFDIGNGAADTVTLTGTINSTNPLYFKGVGSVEVPGDATLAGGVHAQNLSHEDTTTPALNFSGNVTLTGPMEFEGVSAAFANSVEGGGNDLTLNFTQTATLDDFSNVANFTSLGAVSLGGNFTTSGFQKYEGNVTLDSDAELGATTVEFADGVTGNSHNLTLSPTSSSITLDGIQLSGVNELTIGGDLDLAGNLDAQNIDIQGNTTLLGDANLTATGTASGDWSTASLTNTVVTSGSAMKLTLSPDGRHAYIADDNEGMQVVDLQHPSGPAIVGNFDSGVGNALDVVANATHAFVSHWMGDLHIVDVSNPSSPQSVGNVSLPDMGLQFGGTPFGLSLHGDALYVADGDAGIHHVDVSDSANPSVSETFGTGATFFGVTVAGGYTFAATSAGLKVYDGARTNVATASLSGNGHARSVVVSADGQTAFLANFNGGLDIFDISTPSSPQHLDNYSTAGLGHDVALSSDESLAFVADGPNGKLVLDVSDTSNINFVGNHATTGSDTNGNVYDVAVASGDAATFTVTNKSENDPGKAGLDIFSSVTQGIMFGGTVDGSHALSTNGTTSFAGVVGGTDSLASLTTVGGTVSVGGDVTTTGNQSFGGEATIAGDTTFTGDDVSISGLKGGGFNVDFSATSTTLDANAYSVANVANLNVSGDVGLNGTIATTGNQSYGGDVGLLGNTTLTAGAGAISLGTDGDVEGASHTLTLGDANQTGDVTLGGGSTVTLGDLNVAAGNFNLAITAGAGKAVTVSMPVDILSTGDLTVTTASNDIDSVVLFERGLNATAPSAVDVDGVIQTNYSAINLSHVRYTGDGSQPSFLLTGPISDPTPFVGSSITVGSLDTGIGMLVYHGGLFGSLTVQGDANIGVGLSGTGIKGWGDLNINGNTTVGSTVNVEGDQNYAENVSLTGNAVFEGNTATFTNGVLGGGHDLTFKFAQPSKLDGLANVNNFTSSGQIELNGSFETSGSQEFADGVSLGGDATLHAASGFIKLDGIAGETYDLTIGNTTLPAPTADLIITSDVALNALNATTGNYDASLTGASMKLQQATFGNSGNITLGDQATDSLVIGQGLVVQNAAVTTVAGNIASNGSQIKIRNINLTADTHIDTTNGGMVPAGAQILLDGNMQLGGFTLDTKSGAVDTTLEGDITIANGSFKVLQGDLDLGESGNASNAANITVSETATIEVPENGTLNVFDGSKLDAGDNPINIIANNISFQTNAGNFISSNEITITPVTSGNDIFVGNIADTKTISDGLRINQIAYSKMESPNIIIGGSGYTGTIAVENLNSTNSGQLTLIANGTGGAIDVTNLNLSNAGLLIDGSGATTNLSGDITTNGSAAIYDAVRLVGNTNISTSGGDVTITGGLDGIYSESGSSHNLSINAGAGDVVVGNQTGFGNGTTESLIGKVTLDSTSSITLGDGDQEMHSLDVLTSPLELGGSLGTSLILSGGLFGGADLRTGITGNKSFLEIDLQSGFVDVVKLGSITNVNNLAITEDSLSPSPLRKVEMHGDVTTIEGQTYEPTIELRNEILLNAAGNVSIDGTLTAEDGLATTRNVGITATGGTVSINDFGSGTTLGNHYDVAILAANEVNLGGGVGSFGKFQHGLQFLTINTITNSVNFNATSGLSLGGNLSIESSPNVNISSGATLETEGDLTINSTDISLGASVTTDSGTLTLNGTASVTDSIVLDSGSGDLTVTGALLATTNGTHDVTINSGGTAKIGGAVGNATAASDLFFANLTTDAGGTTEFNGNIFAAEQVFNDDIVLNQGLSTDLTAGGVNATFNGNVDAESSDIVLDFTTTAIDGSKWSNLAELTVNADTGGTIGLSGTITSSGSQTYNGAVQLDGDTTLIGGFALNLPQGVTGNSKNLVLDFINQPTSLAGNFTGINDLTSKGDVLISGEIRTSGNQSYAAGVTLDGDTELDGNSLSLNGVNGGDNDLVIGFNTTTAINSNWTNIEDFQAETTVSLTGNFSTLRQWYQNAVTLLGDTVLSASGSGYRGVAFDGTIDGRHDLSINADSTASINFAKAIGSTTPLRSLNLASAAAVEALELLAIDGTGGSGPGLRFGSTVGNINMTAAGSSISNAAQDGILFAGSSTDSTLANFTVTNSGGNGITMAGGDYTNTTIRDTAVTTSGAAAVTMSDDGHGLYANNAIGFTVTDSSMTLNKGSGVYVEGLASDGVTVSNSTFGISGEGLAAGNKGYGVGFAGGSNHVADNNTIGGNDLTGLLAVSPVTGETVSNITFSKNWIGLTRSEEPVPNGQAGIWVLGDVTNSEGYTQGFVDDVKIQGNRVENAVFNGIEIDNAQNVTVGGIGLEPLKHNLIKNSNQYGLAMTGDLAGTHVRGNTLIGNFDSGLYVRDVTDATIGSGIDAAGSLVIEGSSFGVTAIGDLTGTRMTGNRIHTNANAGVFMMGAQNFDVFRNKIEDNGPYGVLAFEESTGTTISGNTIEKSEAGVWLSGASGLTIGYDATGTPAELRVGNKIKDNYSVGIIVQGSTAADNRILSNEIYLNTYYGIQFVGGAAPSVRPPRLFAASLNGDTTTVRGRLNGEIGDTYLIQYFQNKPEDMQPGRAPEGQILVHSSEVVITSEGFVDIDADIVNGQEHAISAGDWITTTATAMKDNVPDQTSVFSSGVRVKEVPDV